MHYRKTQQNTHPKEKPKVTFLRMEFKIWIEKSTSGCMYVPTWYLVSGVLINKIKY